MIIRSVPTPTERMTSTVLSSADISYSFLRKKNYVQVRISRSNLLKGINLVQTREDDYRTSEIKRSNGEFIP